MNLIQSLVPKFWMDATDTGTVATNTSLAVSGVLDKSVNGNNLVQATSGHQPLYVLSDGTNGKPAIRFQTSKWIQPASFSQALNYTIYLYLKQTTFGPYIVLQLGSDYHNSIVQITSNDGGTGALSLAAGSNFQPHGKFSYKSDWHLYRYTNNGGNVIMSIDDGPIFGDIPNGSYNVGTTAISNLIFGDNSGEATDFSMQEAVVLNHAVTTDEHRNIWGYFKSKYQPTAVKTYFAWGDSITQGFGLATVQDTYVYQVGAGLGADYSNAGIPSTNIGYGVSPVQPNNLNALADALDLGISRSSYITFCYGANETIDANWGPFYQSIIQKFIDRGFDRNRICIVTQLAASSASIVASVPYIQAIASNLGIRLADCYTAWLGTGGLIGSPPHPNAAGDAAMATTILTALS